MQTAQVRSNLQIDGDFAARRESVGVPAQSGGEPGFVEQRGMEKIGERANLGGQLLDQGHAVAGGFVQFRIRLLQHAI